MVKSKKQVDITATFFGGVLFWAALLFLLVNGILFAADNMVSETDDITIRQVSFYGIVMLLMVREISYWLKDTPFIFYKKKVTQSSGGANK